jgi:phosphotransferase system enzyme I (PtsI)
MSIPAIIGCPIPLTDDVNGKMAVVDGYEGKIYVEPDDDILADKKKLLLQEEEKKNLLERLKGKENITLDGQKINLYANIGNTKDLGLVLENDASGIGLFRSEFIYLGSDHYPTEDEQFAIYKQVAQTLAGKKVIIRTLDIGADKQADYFELPKEENPAMGLRAIRICLTRPEVFKTQLRAILRASAFGNISIMFPMIISVDEVKRIKKIVEEVKASIEADGLAYDKDIELGIMIETPAAVIIADELAEEVDFFSVGTNDLTQYTLAIDRQNQSLDEFYDPHHPAILKMLQMIVDAAHRHGAWAGICGELGADLSLTKEFLAMGYDELSVSPGRILPIRKTVLETNVTEYKKETGRV